jgi:hypothetical protein
VKKFKMPWKFFNPPRVKGPIRHVILGIIPSLQDDASVRVLGMVDADLYLQEDVMRGADGTD